MLRVEFFFKSSIPPEFRRRRRSNFESRVQDLPKASKIFGRLRIKQCHVEPITSGFDNSAPEVSASCKEVNGSYLIRLTSKRRTVRTYGFVTT
ncbi:hypothetical protein LINGRAHAP2_LOCUS23888, partial [Linum grandiflorum]